MKSIWSHGVAFGLGALCCGIAVKRHYAHVALTRPGIEAVFSAERGRGPGGLDRFGIQPGDILLNVNGVTDETMLKELVNGYNRGNVCITLERAEKTREICVRQKQGVR
jgi:hypothetical protein